MEKRTKSPISHALQIGGHLSTDWNCYSRKGTNNQFLLPPKLQSTLFLARAVFFLTLAETQSHETSFQGWYSPAGGSTAGSKMATPAEEAKVPSA